MKKLTRKLGKLMGLSLLVMGTITGCGASTTDTFKEQFNAGSYTECLSLYSNKIQGNEEAEKVIQDYLWNIATETLKEYREDSNYLGSVSERKLDTIGTYVTENTVDLEKVIAEYENLKVSREAYIDGKEALTNEDYQQAHKLFQEVDTTDTLFADAQELKNQANTKWKAKIFTDVDAHIQNKDYDAALSVLNKQTYWLEKDQDYIDTVAKVKALQQEEIARQEEEKRKEEEAKKAAMQQALNRMSISRDDFADITWYYDPSTPRYTNQNSFHIYAGESDTISWLRLCIQYYADSWLFIQSYSIKVDGVTYTITPEKYGDVQRDNGGGMIWEWYDISPSAEQIEMLRAIANSNEAIIRFNGRQYYDDRTITASEKQAIKNVLNAYDALRFL